MGAVLAVALIVSVSALPGTGGAVSVDGAAHLDEHAIAGVGSSSMYGRGPGRAPFLTVLAESLGPPWRAVNAGEPGIHAAACLDRWRSKVRGHGFGALVVLCGLNDIRAGSSAAAVWATLQILLDEALADGLRVVPMTLQPFKGDRAWTPEKQAQLVALNAAMLLYCGARKLTCVDTYVALEDRGNCAMQPRYDAGDHLHMSQAAHDLLARSARAAFP